VMRPKYRAREGWENVEEGRRSSSGVSATFIDVESGG
jgi:hypothetical protein